MGRMKDIALACDEAAEFSNDGVTRYCYHLVDGQGKHHNVVSAQPPESPELQRLKASHRTVLLAAIYQDSERVNESGLVAVKR